MSLANREFKLNYSGVRQKQMNTSYPFTGTVTCIEDLAKIAAFDHVGAIFADGKNSKGRVIQGYRSKKTFQSATVVIMDCDNTEPDPLKPDIPPEEAPDVHRDQQHVQQLFRHGLQFSGVPGGG